MSSACPAQVDTVDWSNGDESCKHSKTEDAGMSFGCDSRSQVMCTGKGCSGICCLFHAGSVKNVVVFKSDTQSIFKYPQELYFDST